MLIRLSTLCLLTAALAGSAVAIEPVTWRYTTARPADGWEKPGFDDTGWLQAPGGFGEKRTPGSQVRTRWATGDIWLRRTFDLAKVPAMPALLIHHDEDAELFINGREVGRFEGHLRNYRVAALDNAGQASLKQGENLLAVHCRQTTGGQYIDVHVVDSQALPELPAAPAAAAAAAQDVDATPVYLRTTWGENIKPGEQFTEYPRPQLARREWKSLNGHWDYAITGEDGQWRAGRVENAKFDPLLGGVPRMPDTWDGKILVPFSPEVTLSGVQRLVRPHQLLWYRRTFEVPADWRRRRVRLNFEAVDWHAIVLVNGRQVADNRGGYVPFSCDVTDALAESAEQELLLVVWDPTNMGDQTIGKQALPELRKGFRYTPNSGIWQPVWMEPVSEESIDRLKIVPDVDGGRVSVTATTRGAKRGVGVQVEVLQSDRTVAKATGKIGQPIELEIPDARLWSPDDPFLYDLKVTLNDDDDDAIDQVTSYFGMRKISIGLYDGGIPRISLNNEPIFQYGPLDQGYWPDGSLTPSSDEATRFDVEYLKKIGCNMVRVHIKVHPDRWYHYCDKLGLLVWQDFVCSRKFDVNITPESAAQWELEQRQMIDHLHNHPSVVQWIVFNEGWGQYDTERLTEWTWKYDPTRLVTCASGWTDFPVGDVYDNHDYSFSPSTAIWSSDNNSRAVVLGECGGHNVYVDGHLWWPDRVGSPAVDPVGDGGRETYADGNQWLARYRPWLTQLRLLQAYGLNAAVYTQITDVEHECNGWLTFDRKVSKVDEATLSGLHRQLYRPVETRSLLPREKAGRVRYTAVDSPPDGWATAGFDDANWQAARPNIERPVTLDPVVPAKAAERRELLVRCPFQLDAVPSGPVAMRIGGRGQFDVYLGGELIKSISNSLRSDHVPGSAFVLHEEARQQLREGANLLAICVKGTGSRESSAPGQLIHLELVEVVNQ